MSTAATTWRRRRMRKNRLLLRRRRLQGRDDLQPIFPEHLHIQILWMDGWVEK